MAAECAYRSLASVKLRAHSTRTVLFSFLVVVVVVICGLAIGDACEQHQHAK